MISSSSSDSSLGVPSDRFHDVEPPSTSRLSSALIQSPKRRMSTVGSPDKREDHNEHSPKKRKLRAHRQTKGLSSKTSAASADMSVKPDCRRSLRIAMQTFKSMSVQNAKLRTSQRPKPLDNSRHRPASTAIARAKSRRSR